VQCTVTPLYKMPVQSLRFKNDKSLHHNTSIYLYYVTRWIVYYKCITVSYNAHSNNVSIETIRYTDNHMSVQWRGWNYKVWIIIIGTSIELRHTFIGLESCLLYILCTMYNNNYVTRVYCSFKTTSMSYGLMLC